MTQQPIFTQRTEVHTPEDMHLIGKQIGKWLRAGDAAILTGPLGAGKTTLTRGIGEVLGIRGAVTSPTFVLARTHPSLEGGPPLVHVDAYRLQGATELDDLDLDFDNSVVIIEWGANMLENLDSWIEVTIDRPTGESVVANESGVTSESDFEEELVETRIVTVRGYGDRWKTQGAMW